MSRQLMPGNFIGKDTTDSPMSEGGVWTVSNNTEFFIKFNPVIFIEDFETGSLGDSWKNVTQFDVTNAGPASPFSGQYAGIITNDSDNLIATLQPSIIVDGTKIYYVEWFYYPDDNSTGWTIVFMDANDNYIIGVSSANPQIYTQVDDGSGNPDGWTKRVDKASSEGQENDWSRIRLTFNWTNGTYDFEFENMETGNTVTRTDLNLGSTTNIKRMDFSPGDTSGWLSSGSSNKNNVMFDDITISL